MSETADFPAPRCGDRSLFPRLTTKAYLNHAAISPLPEPVLRRTSQQLTTMAEEGLGAFPQWLEQRTTLKEKLGRLVGTSGERLALVGHTTQAILNVAMNFAWKRGDRILLFRGEFPANTTPWLAAAEQFGLEIRWLDAELFRSSPAEAMARFEKELAAGVRLCAVSFVQFQTGLQMPIKAMAARCQPAGTRLCVDGIQGCGVVPFHFDAWGVDFLACGSHKWLLAPEGAAFLAISEGAMTDLLPRAPGWLSHEEGLRFLFEGPGHLRYDRPYLKTPLFFERGATNATGCAGWEAAVDILLAVGVGNIFEHLQAYHDKVEKSLGANGLVSLRSSHQGGRSGSLCFRFEGDVVALNKALSERGVACSIPDGRLRLAPHYANPLSEAEWVAEQIAQAARGMGA